jgi:hypothetical protein
MDWNEFTPSRFHSWAGDAFFALSDSSAIRWHSPSVETFIYPAGRFNHTTEFSNQAMELFYRTAGYCVAGGGY